MAISFDIKMDGLEAFVKKLEQAPKKVMDVLPDEVQKEAETIMDKSKGLVPIDTGFLRDSGYVGRPEISGDTISLDMGYTAPYAIFVHEDMTANHPRGGQAKFLQQPLMEAEGSLWDNIADRVKLRLSR